MTEGYPKPSDDLLALLEQKGLLSAPQIAVARNDMHLTGLSAADVLIARRWLDESTLQQLQPQKENVAEPSLDIYQENLKRYRHYIEQILGE